MEMSSVEMIHFVILGSKGANSDSSQTEASPLKWVWPHPNSGRLRICSADEELLKRPAATGSWSQELLWNPNEPSRQWPPCTRQCSFWNDEMSVIGSQVAKATYVTTSVAILRGNLPTLVPPNFCTSHLADGSTVFWCRLGGVLGG